MAGRGRPRLPDNELRSVQIAIRLTVSEKASIDRAAASQDTTVSNWIRDFIIEISRADLSGELD